MNFVIVITIKLSTLSEKTLRVIPVCINFILLLCYYVVLYCFDLFNMLLLQFTFNTITIFIFLLISILLFLEKRVCSAANYQEYIAGIVHFNTNFLSILSLLPVQLQPHYLYYYCQCSLFYYHYCNILEISIVFVIVETLSLFPIMSLPISKSSNFFAFLITAFNCGCIIYNVIYFYQLVHQTIHEYLCLSIKCYIVN